VEKCLILREEWYNLVLFFKITYTILVQGPVQLSGTTLTAEKLFDILERLVDSEMPSPVEFAPV
jgi:hypothetical protein